MHDGYLWQALLLIIVFPSFFGGLIHANLKEFTCMMGYLWQALLLINSVSFFLFLGLIHANFKEFTCMGTYWQAPLIN